MIAMRMIKFQTSSLRIGPLEGSILYRMLLITFIVLGSIFFFGEYGFVSLALLPLFLFKIQHDYVDEYLLKKIRGITVSTLDPLLTDRSVSYEIFAANYGLSEQQDRNIIYIWSSIVGSFSEDMMVVRHPYSVPLERFHKGTPEYDSLFSNSVFYADAYFIIISKARQEDFEKTLGSYGIPFSKLTEGEVGVLNELI